MTYRENDTHSNETLTSAPYTTLRSTKVAIDIIVIQSPYKFNYLSEIWQGDCRQIVYQEDMILGSHAKSFGVCTTKALILTERFQTNTHGVNRDTSKGSYLVQLGRSFLPRQRVYKALLTERFAC